MKVKDLKLDFSDVLIEPCESEITLTRKSVDIEIEWLDTNKMIADQYTKLLDPIYKYQKAIRVVSGKHDYRISHIDDLESNDLTRKDV